MSPLKANSLISFSFVGIYNWCLINANDGLPHHYKTGALDTRAKLMLEF